MMLKECRKLRLERVLGTQLALKSGVKGLKRTLGMAELLVSSLRRKLLSCKNQLVQQRKKRKNHLRRKQVRRRLRNETFKEEIRKTNETLGKTAKEARQFIAHGRIAIGERKVRSPSVIVSRKEEELIRLTNLQKPSGDKQ